MCTCMIHVHVHVHVRSVCMCTATACAHAPWTPNEPKVYTHYTCCAGPGPCAYRGAPVTEDRIGGGPAGDAVEAAACLGGRRAGGRREGWTRRQACALQCAMQCACSAPCARRALQRAMQCTAYYCHAMQWLCNGARPRVLSRQAAQVRARRGRGHERACERCRDREQWPIDVREGRQRACVGSTSGRAPAKSASRLLVHALSVRALPSRGSGARPAIGQSAQIGAAGRPCPQVPRVRHSSEPTPPESTARMWSLRMMAHAAGSVCELR